MPIAVAGIRRRSNQLSVRCWLALTLGVAGVMDAGSHALEAEGSGPAVDFNREIRPILSNRCYACHGPDASKRKGVSKPLRLDTEAGALEDLGGYAAIVKGDPDQSDLIQRVTSDDVNEVMPPPRHSGKLTAAEVERLTTWIRQGARYARHWSYERPARVDPPAVRDTNWPRNDVDRFLLARIEREGLTPAPEADRPTLIRRLALDLTGLPPTPDEVRAFVADDQPQAYERLVDRLLAKPSYGEHWARMWLDLARYADSAGYADDPAREIWAYRDYVIRSFNANKPFDRFTIEQIAGDLLPDATDETRIATAFHRNTMTNSEGGTNDEEFRTAAVVDRVGTTMSVWMGTTIACAQCHDHKYDPLSQADFFRLYAFLNNTEDADRNDESPVLPVESDELKRRKREVLAEIDTRERKLRTLGPELAPELERWKDALRPEPAWTAPHPDAATQRDQTPIVIGEDGSVPLAAQPAAETTRVTLPLTTRTITALNLEVSVPPSGTTNSTEPLEITRVRAALQPPAGARPTARFVRVELPGKDRFLALAEVQVFRGDENVAPKGEASQSSTAFESPARLANDGNTNGAHEDHSVTHTAKSDDPWWELDLQSPVPVDRVVLWNRTDGKLQSRLDGAKIVLLDEQRRPLWTRELAKAPQRSAEFGPGSPRPIPLTVAHRDGSRVVELPGQDDGKPWRIDAGSTDPQRLTLFPAEPVAVEPGSSLVVSVEVAAKPTPGLPGRLRIQVSDDRRAAELARLPAPVLAILKGSTSPSAAQVEELARFYGAEIAPANQPDRDRLTELRRQLAAMKPETTVPVLRELASGSRRVTRIQLRGNFMNLGDEVTEGVPEAIYPLPPGSGRDRLALARWLVADENPMTARVVANRYWETIFGTGLVPTSEEFGSQGELPSHPELLDWLATELVAHHWDLKHLLRTLVTSAAYRQDSRATPESIQKDPTNQWLARGPRFRLPAETIRYQALAIAGLLSPRMYGPPVRPPQPSSGLTAAFGSKIDWQTSAGEDKYRRGIYTTWRRSNPYPSMSTFDAPSREVCTVRRTRTNTPLQALVTLNDPVYVEASQALARRIVAADKDTVAQTRQAYQLCLCREPNEAEVGRMQALYREVRSRFESDRDAATRMATEPLGPAPAGSDVTDLATWTVVANVMLNLDETLMRR